MEVCPQLTLTKLTPEWIPAYLAMLEDFLAAGEERYRTHLEKIQQNAAAYIQKMKEVEQGIDLEEGFVPQTSFWLVRDGSTFVGESRLRHWLTPALEQHGGHIGYAIRPSERKQGYGTCILALTLEEARRIGLKRVLVTCDTDNIASARIIEKNGGVLDNRLISEQSGRMISRYWINLLSPVDKGSMAIQPGTVVQVAQVWKVTYPDPLTLSAGELVQIIRRDDEWLGWIWCINTDEKGGWAPESWLEIDEAAHTAIAKRDYTAIELETQPGEHLVIQQVESGWAWATNEAGQSGWVPLSHITAA